MGIKTAEIAVYPVSIFNTDKNFWLGSLNRILERVPRLEYPHKQDFYMLLFIEFAEGEVMIDHQTIRLDQQKVICIKPNSVFSININRNAAGNIICFTEDFFSLRYNNNVLYQFSFLKKEADNYARLSEQDAEKWSWLINLMTGEYANPGKATEKVLRSYLNILLNELDRKLYRHGHQDVKSSKEEKLIKFEQLLENNFQKHKTPSFYAEKLFITANYLNKLCHECRGFTSGEIIRKRVIIEARRLLHYTGLSVAEVAYKLGFDSPSYFITFFKKHTGTTPELFRKENQ